MFHCSVRPDAGSGADEAPCRPAVLLREVALRGETPTGMEMSEPQRFQSLEPAAMSAFVRSDSASRPRSFGGRRDRPELSPASGHRPQQVPIYIAMSNTRTASVVEATLMIRIAMMLSQMPPLTMLPMLT